MVWSSASYQSFSLLFLAIIGLVGPLHRSLEEEPPVPGKRRLVAGTDTLVVLAYIQGAGAAWPKGQNVPRPKKVKIRIGAPLSFKEVERTKEGFAKVAERAQIEVSSLQPTFRTLLRRVQREFKDFLILSN